MLLVGGCACLLVLFQTWNRGIVETPLERVEGVENKM